ncbi:MAG: hypothetical protein KAU20_02325 [Nanoarchaeota archaeon]|nr:hypothetical protein [Nanoarchaeota archaeon]
MMKICQPESQIRAERQEAGFQLELRLLIIQSILISGLTYLQRLHMITLSGRNSLTGFLLTNGRDSVTKLGF